MLFKKASTRAVKQLVSATVTVDREFKLAQTGGTNSFSYMKAVRRAQTRQTLFMEAIILMGITSVKILKFLIL